MPQILKEWRVLEGDTCQLFLSCSVSSSGNVSYAWYRGSELIQTEMNLTRSEEQVVNDSYIYTCNVSNPVSSANHTLRLTQGCPTASKRKWDTGLIGLKVLDPIIRLRRYLGIRSLGCLLKGLAAPPWGGSGLWAQGSHKPGLS